MSAGRTMRALDLFCGAGGAAMGLHRAGFAVTGIDIRPQPRYPFAFIQADALAPPVDLAAFDLVWASPPCQEFTTIAIAHRAGGRRSKYGNLIPQTRALLQAARGLTVIENVVGSPLDVSLVLTGDMFGLNTYRRRHFECNFFVLAPRRGRPFGPISRPGAVTVAGTPGNHAGVDRFHRRHTRGNKAAWAAAIGIDWMLARELTQAIPPAYAEFIGRAALAYLARRAAA